MRIAKADKLPIKKNLFMIPPSFPTDLQKMRKWTLFFNNKDGINDEKVGMNYRDVYF